MSIVWNYPAGIHLRCARNTAARFERRRHLRGKQPWPARPVAPLLAGFLARQIRGVPIDPGRQASLPATGGGRPVAGRTGAKEAVAGALARSMDAISHGAAARFHEQTTQPGESRDHHRCLASAGAADWNDLAVLGDRYIRF